MEGLRSKRPQRVNELLRMNERGRRTLVSPGTADPGGHEVADRGPPGLFYAFIAFLED